MLISKFASDNNSIDIDSFQKQYTIILPYQYKQFLLKYNGGYTPKTIFRQKKVSSDIKGFYGIGDAKLNLNELSMEEWIDRKLMPIACDSFGNYFVIGLGKRDEGKVFFCDHEYGYKTIHLTDSFVDFVRKCSSERISEASRMSIREREDALIKKGRGDIISDDLRKIWQAEIDKYKDMVQEEVILK